MKQDLSPTAVKVVLGVVALVVIAAGFLYFRPSIGQGPPLTPKKWAPPGQWAGAPGTAPGKPAAPAQGK
jgi:hypothetical protein